MRTVGYIIFSCCFICFYLLSCSGPYSGNGTLTGNPVIVGKVYKVDGSTPATDALIYMRDKNALCDLSSIGSTSGVTITHTDSDGFFKIETPEDGIYTIECTDGNNNYALYESVAVSDGKNEVRLPDNTLKPAGTIKGTIHLPEGGDPQKVYVLVFGVERFAMTDISGKFILNNIPEGQYSLRFMSSMSEYEAYDTNGVTVVSGMTTDIGTVTLSYNTQSPVKNFKAELDTFGQFVLLSWDSVKIPGVEGYNVYKKKSSGKEFLKVNDSVLTAPVFKDLDVITNETYSYRVCVFKKDSSESVKSETITIHVINTFMSLEKSFNIGIPGPEGKTILSKKCIVSSTGYVYLINGCTVQKYDNDLNVLSNIAHDSLHLPYELAAGNDGRVYISDKTSGTLDRICVFNDDGSLHKIFSFNITSGSTNNTQLDVQAILFSINSKEQIAIVSKNRDSVYLFDTSGTMLGSIGNFGGGSEIGNGGISQVLFDKNDNIYVNDFAVGLKVYDSTFNYIKTINFSGKFPEFSNNNISEDEISQLLPVYGIYVDPALNLIMAVPDVWPRTVYMFDLDGKMVSKIQTSASNPCILRNKNTLFILGFNGIERYSFNLP